MITTPGHDTQKPQTIIDEVAAFVRRFVWLKDDTLYVLVATWIVETYLVDQFPSCGYLFIASNVRSSGKTRLLEGLDLLVHNSAGIQVSITEAVLFRTASGYTQLFDEMDTLMHHEFIRGVLNAGYRRGASVTRLRRDESGGFEPVHYPVYAPRVMAGIGEQMFHHTTLDRTFVIRMSPRAVDNIGERFRPDRLESEVSALKRSIEEWATSCAAEVRARFEADTRVFYLTQFRERTVDISEPLAAIIETDR